MEEEKQRMESSPLCEECKEKAWKYRCPGCSLRSCSLPCVNSHKKRTGCTGKRDRTQFVPLSQFDDNLLLSDYNLLEEMKRVAESSQRSRACMYPHFRLPFHLQILKNAAGGRGTRLRFLPKGMSKREKNQSVYDKRKKFISWTIEWRFHSTDVNLLDHGVHEETTVSSVIEKHLQPSCCSRQLKQFCKEPLDSLRFFIRKYPGGPNSPFCQLDIKAPLREQLFNVVILEHPVIYVFLPSHQVNFEVVKAGHPAARRSEVEKEVGGGDQSQRGVTFKVEEVKEDDTSPVSQVCGTANNTTPMHQIPQCDMSGKSFAGSVDGPLCTSAAASNNSQFISKSLEPGIFGEIEFDLDQELQDTYSSIIAQMNPDEFFDIDDEITKLAEVKDERSASVSRGSFPINEDLEEGEIAEH